MKPDDAELARYIRDNMRAAGYPDSDIEEEIDIARTDLSQTREDLSWIGWVIAAGAAAAVAVIAYAGWR